PPACSVRPAVSASGAARAECVPARLQLRRSLVRAGGPGPLVWHVRDHGRAQAVNPSLHATTARSPGVRCAPAELGAPSPPTERSILFATGSIRHAVLS